MTKKTIAAPSTRQLIVELCKGLFVSAVVAFCIVWILEECVKGKGLQAFLAKELLSIILTLAAVYTAIVGLILTQISGLRVESHGDDSSQVRAFDILSGISSALQISFVEILVQVALAVISMSLAGGRIQKELSWSWFALDITNVAVFIWAIWLLWDIGSAMFATFGQLTDALRSSRITSAD